MYFKLPYLHKSYLGRTDRQRDREHDCGNLVSLGTDLKINQLSARDVMPSSRVQCFLLLQLFPWCGEDALSSLTWFKNRNNLKRRIY